MPFLVLHTDPSMRLCHSYQMASKSGAMTVIIASNLTGQIGDLWSICSALTPAAVGSGQKRQLRLSIKSRIFEPSLCWLVFSRMGRPTDPHLARIDHERAYAFG